MKAWTFLGCGTRVAQLAEHSTLDWGSDHGLRGMRSSPPSGSVLGVELASDSLPLSPPTYALSLSPTFPLLFLCLSKKKKGCVCGR